MSAASKSPPLYPLRFRPVLKDYVWGGRNLDRILGRVLPDGPVAESWEISDHPNGQTSVTGGACDRMALGELLRTCGADLVGTRNLQALRRGRFPLLIKLLDANDWLSVQVHPADGYARRHENDIGKTEMWVVLHAETEAEVLLGFERPTGPAEITKALETGRFESLLHRVPARRGDVFFVPAGTVHAIGPGLLLAEIQQASDVTYRIFDWNRSDPLGEQRALHIDKALDVVDLSVIRPGAARPVTLSTGAVERELLAECVYFRTERIRIDGSAFQGYCDGATFEIWALLSGSAVVESGAGPVRLQPLSWLLLPAGMGRFEVRCAGQAELLRVLTPENPSFV